MNDERSVRAARGSHALAGEAEFARVVVPTTRTEHPSAGDPQALSHRDKRLIAISMMLPVFLGSVDQSVLASALPTIGRDLGGVHNLPWLDHRFSDRLDRADPALRQVRRYPRPARRHAHRHLGLHDRLAYQRRLARHADAHWRPRGPGLRRRRARGHRQHGPRRHRRAERARALLHLFLTRLHDRGRQRTGAGRVDCRASALVGDLFVEFSTMRGRARDRIDRAAAAATPRTAAPA